VTPDRASREGGLAALVAAELAEPVDPRVAALAAAVAARHGAASRAVLFYGSCLRERELDGLMLDFYLIVSDYRATYEARWLATANRLLPPNVFPFEAGGLAAKYAVLSERDLASLCGPGADNPSVWARFAQPARIVWAADEGARAVVVAAVAEAVPTLFDRTVPTMAAPAASVLDVWRCGFALTYGAELRAERGGRSGAIVEADPARYERFGLAALHEIAARRGGGEAAPILSSDRAAAGWRRTQRRGKLLTLARLAKASATFSGGLDYLAWKINRHADAEIAIRPWQRRWPVIGALSLLPRLLARGAVR
jgi:hypothetical protein